MSSGMTVADKNVRHYSDKKLLKEDILLYKCDNTTFTEWHKTKMGVSIL